MVCQYLEDVFELYLLGVSSAVEANTISAHLQSGCQTCFAHLREATLTVYLLCQPSKPGRLDPKLKARLLRRIQKQQGGHPAR